LEKNYWSYVGQAWRRLLDRIKSELTLKIGCLRILKLPMAAIMGMMSGMQTKPACLAYANQQAQNDLLNLWYATVYPASMIAKILLAQIIVTTLLML
jgi:uncharacterized transporter YbjL